jgi:serine/threonine protein kinase
MVEAVEKFVPSSNELPARFGKYVRRSVLGTGATGTVYLAHDTILDRDVALKVFDRRPMDSPADRARFLLEARSVTHLSHPRTVTVFDINEVAGEPYLAMEWMKGGSTQQAIDSRGPIPWEEATRWMRDACEGLSAAHQAGLLHRDLKPANLLLCDDGAVKLADFGLVKQIGDLDTNLTLHGGPIGTPSFMSPEQCRSEATDECSDIYSLGATYYALLTGRPPYPSSSPLGVMFAHCSSPVPDLAAWRSTIPAACEEIIQKSMAKDPTHRYPSADAMLTDLDQILGRPSAPIPQPSATPRRHRRLLAATVPFVVLGIIGASWWSTNSTSPPAIIQPDPAATLSAAATVQAKDASILTPPATPSPSLTSFPSVTMVGDLRGQVADLDFDATGKTIVTVGTRGTLAVWDPNRPRQWLKRLLDPQESRPRLMALGLLRSSNLAIVGGTDGEMALWDLDKGTILQRIPHSHGVLRAIDVSADEKRCVTGGDVGWNRWRITKDYQFIDEGHIDQRPVLVQAVRFSQNLPVVGAASGSGEILFHNLIEPSYSKQITISGHGIDVAFGKTRGDLAYLGDRGKAVLGSITVRLKEPRSLSVPGEKPSCLDFSPTHRLLAAGTESGRIIIFDLDRKNHALFNTGHSELITVIRFSPAGDRLVWGDSAGDIFLAQVPLDKFSPPTRKSELTLDLLANHLPEPQAVSKSLEAFKPFFSPRQKEDPK